MIHIWSETINLLKFGENGFLKKKNNHNHNIKK